MSLGVGSAPPDFPEQTTRSAYGQLAAAETDAALLVEEPVEGFGAGGEAPFRSLVNIVGRYECRD
jgi:hypothetical protein